MTKVLAIVGGIVGAVNAAAALLTAYARYKATKEERKGNHDYPHHFRKAPED